jgi:hypothetical protein
MEAHFITHYFLLIYNKTSVQRWENRLWLLNEAGTKSMKLALLLVGCVDGWLQNVHQL